MAHAFTPGLAVGAGIKVQKIRELPLPGEVLVEVGARVTANQEVARALLPGELHLYRLPEKMGLEPFEVLKGLRVREGQEVQVGTLICEHAGFFGWFKSRFLSEVAGAVEFVSERTGHVGVRAPSNPITLSAYIAGTVVGVESGKSVTVETTGVLVQGIFGVGGERSGKLHLLNLKPGEDLSVAALPESCAGLILVGGTRPTAEVLKTAARRGAVGLIVGSVDDEALTEYVGHDIGIALTGDEAVTMTLIVTEGFGSIAMAERVLDLLRNYQGKECSINGATQVRAGALRPELIVPEQASQAGAAEKCGGGLEVGSRVRLIRVPYFGQNAIVTELPHAVEVIPTGAHARVLRAKLTSGEIVTVPRANVELLDA